MNFSIIFSGISAAIGLILLIFVGRQISVESKLRKSLSDVKRLEDLETDLKDSNNQLEFMERQLSEAEQEILGDCKNIERYQSIIQQNQNAEPVAIAEAMVEACSKDDQEIVGLIERQRNLSSQLKEKAKISEKQQTTKEELNKLQKELEEIKFPKLPEGIIFSEELFKETSSKKEKLGQDLRENETLLKTSREELQKLKDFIEENKELPTQVENQVELVTSLKRELEIIRLSIEGVDKTAEALRNRVKPGVEQYMGMILPMITNGRYKAVQMDDNYSFQVWDPDAGEFKIKEVFSGGTEDQFLLSMRLAFALALLPEVKGMHPEFLFLDEPLGSSDEERREGIIQLLNTELSAKFKQIFLISHVANLQTEVQNIIRLENGRVIEK